jgi:hypothetical protein
MTGKTQTKFTIQTIQNEYSYSFCADGTSAQGERVLKGGRVPELARLGNPRGKIFMSLQQRCTKMKHPRHEVT